MARAVGPAQAKPHALSNVAEELALYVIIGDAKAHLEIQEIDDPAAIQALDDLMEDAYEDNDFLALWDDDLPDPEVRIEMGFTPVELRHWFEPFSSPEHRGMPHPYLRED